ncbi:MAG: S8 family serine peptidase [bacterium]|nr:S8 family serine peptidase [bacterium]
MATFKVTYGGKKGKAHRFVYSNDHVVVRTHSHREVAASVHSRAAREALDQVESVFQLPMHGIEVYKVRAARGRAAARDKVRGALKKEKDVRFAGRVLHDASSKQPVLYTENLFVKFENDRSTTFCKKSLRSHNVKIIREVDYARNGFFVRSPEGCGTDVFHGAEQIMGYEGVDCVHPELVREMRKMGAFPQQWHLQKAKIGRLSINEHANVVAAWAETEGKGTVIAVVDDGVDMAHEEFSSAGKIVAPRNVSLGNDDPSPGPGDHHGTACAGVACGDGLFGAAGVAPKAKLMPIRLVSGLGSQAEAEAFVWSAQNGADVISCSWGPPDGHFRNPNDSRHKAIVPLPDSTKLAIDFALEHGRGGKGCVIVWAAGNGNESVDNDGYASYEKVIAVAACNDEGKRSEYSDYGDAIWCSFPSNDFRPTTRTPGIWTADRSGAEGYNPGREFQGDPAGNYTNSFGGTSSACPGVAGVAALILARNPELRWDEVKELLKGSCDQIDKKGGKYDKNGHSKLYGYGRVDTARAVKSAKPKASKYASWHTAFLDVPVKKGKTATIELAVAEDKPLRKIKVQVKIEHEMIGNLVARLVTPGGEKITLHDREGRALVDLRKEYDTLNAPALADLLKTSPVGTWTLEVDDTSVKTHGMLRSFGMLLGF